ncbi:MAG: trigger factor [Bacteroidota bacterium]
MATIERTDIDALNATLTVTVAQEDYKGELNKELKRYRNQASLKGFRKGKTPMSVVRKMFGRSILADVINRQMQEELSEYLYDKENPLNILGQPIPSADQEEFEFSVASLTDYVFKFDIGLAPEFEVKGLGDRSFERFVIDPGSDKIAEELENLRRRFGKNEEVQDVVEERDIITLKAVELEDGAPKVAGIMHEFTLFIQNTTDEAKAAFLGKNIGDTAELNVFELEAGTTEDHVRKYLLGLDAEDDREVNPVFSLTIDKISRNVPAELGEEFYQQAFGEGDVSTEEEALAKIQEDYNGYYIKQTDALLFRDMQEYLMEQNSMELPEEFLKRWLVASNEQNTPEGVEAGFAGFRKGLEWTLVREKLINKFELEVKQEELRASFAEQVLGYFGGGQPEWLNEEMVSGMVDRMMNEENSVRDKFDELINDKLSDKLQGEYELKDKAITPEELQAIIEEIRAEQEAESQLLAQEEEE